MLSLWGVSNAFRLRFWGEGLADKEYKKAGGSLKCLSAEVLGGSLSWEGMVKSKQPGLKCLSAEVLGGSVPCKDSKVANTSQMPFG